MKGWSQVDNIEGWGYPNSPRVTVLSDGRERTCGDNYGDIECGSCDFVLAPEGRKLSVGDFCKRCHAEVYKIEVFKELELPMADREPCNVSDDPHTPG